MKSFQYATATSAQNAAELRGEDGRYLGGGIDLLAQMKEYIAQPKVLVNIKALPGLDRIEPGEKIWTLGTNVTVSQIEEDAGVGKVFPGLQQAAAEVGSKQIRNVATLGGNLAQHSRCWYYRHRDVQCLKKGGDTCYARHGENKYHSLFTGNTCISPVVSNLAVALAVLEATVVVQRAGQILRWSIPEFYAKAWDNPTAHNSLDPGDLILRIEVPVRALNSVYLQASEKSAFDWALVSCAAAGQVQEGKFSQVRLALGAVSNVPHQVPEANEYLEGKPRNEETIREAAELLVAKAQPHSENGYKIPLSRALVRRALMRL